MYEVSLQGFLFDTISEAVYLLRQPPLSRSRLWDVVLDIRRVREDRTSLYPTGESIDEAFAQTLTMADKPLFSDEPETYHAKDFQHSCVYLYERTLAMLEREGRFADLADMEREWEMEYQRLTALVENYQPPMYSVTIEGTTRETPRFLRDMQLTCQGRKLFSTSRGYIGIGDITLETGDMICVFFGGRTPFIVRTVNGKYKFVGECYLHGIMHGEELKNGRPDRRLITLV